MARANPPVDLTPDLWVSTKTHTTTQKVTNSFPDPQADPRCNRSLVRHQGREVEPSSGRGSSIRCSSSARRLRRSEPIRPTSWCSFRLRPAAGRLRPTARLPSPTAARWIRCSSSAAGWLPSSTGWLWTAAGRLRSSPASSLLSNFLRNPMSMPRIEVILGY